MSLEDIKYESKYLKEGKAYEITFDRDSGNFSFHKLRTRILPNYYLCKKILDGD